MGFLEHIGNSLTSIQPWREFPPGHPRHGETLGMICEPFFRNVLSLSALFSRQTHGRCSGCRPSLTFYQFTYTLKICVVAPGIISGEPPPTPEEERRRLSRLRVLRFALTIVVAYAVRNGMFGSRKLVWVLLFAHKI